MRSFVRLASMIAVLFVQLPLLAQQSGAVPVRIPNNPSPRCINGKTDQVWLTLYRVVTTKNRGFLSNENQAQIIAKVQVKTKPQAAQAIAFPLAARVNIRSYSAGQVSLPVEYTLVSGLNLKQTEGTTEVLYTGFAVDTTLVNIKSKNGLGTALQALSEITGADKLPIPDSPYRQAAGYLLQFANKAVERDLAEKNADDKLTSSSLALNFDPTGTCADTGADGAGFETTGTKAIVMAAGSQGNLIPIDKTTDYCWKADVSPSFVLKAARKVSGKQCTDATYETAYRDITNDYIAYFLQKRTISTTLAGAERVRRELREAKQLCDALNVATCPAAVQ